MPSIPLSDLNLRSNLSLPDRRGGIGGLFCHFSADSRVIPARIRAGTRKNLRFLR